MEDAESDLTELRMKRWRYHINSREVWVSIVKEAKALKGSWSQYVANDLRH